MALNPPWWSHTAVKCCSTLLRTVTAQQWTRWPQSVLRTWEQARRKDRDHAAGRGTAMDLAPCPTSSTRSGMLPTDAPRSADVEGLSIWCQQPLGDVFLPLQYPESLQAPAQHCTVWWEMGISGGRGSTCCTLFWGNATRAFCWKREVGPWEAAVTHQEKSMLVIPLQELCISLPKRKINIITVVVCRVPGFSEQICVS
ncbi:uncharacterized protein LOC143161986 [Aptenodytes patagonicus]|uniref:uncharacterized protein LOC143161986 n=1 Tax=Aptenodytes patagonicus TaxID=9234 RepID=UPI003FA131BF